MSEVEIEALRQKVTTPEEPIEVLIENDPVYGSDIAPVIEIGVEQNHSAVDGDMDGTDDLHKNDDTQRIRRMMQENSRDPILSLNLDELENLLRVGVRLLCNKVGAIANKRNLKNHTGKTN